MDADLLIDADASPADEHGEHTPPARTWFEAQTAFGPAHLSVPGAVQHAAGAAIALQRCEPLLDGLDIWGGGALDWRWSAEPAPMTASTHASAAWSPGAPAPHGSEAACQIDLPWQWLRSLPAPESALAAQLQWLEVPAVVAISQVRLDAAEMSLLEPGGAVVLHESLQPCWHGLLRALDEPAEPGRGVPIMISTPARVTRLKADAAAGRAPWSGSADDAAWCEVRLVTRHAIPADRLAGWSEDEVGDIAARASLWRCGTDDEPAMPLAVGQLLPWGDGWALALEALCDDAPAPAAMA